MLKDGVKLIEPGMLSADLGYTIVVSAKLNTLFMFGRRVSLTPFVVPAGSFPAVANAARHFVLVHKPATHQGGSTSAPPVQKGS